MKDAEIFLEIAKEDLKAANCLYQDKLYPQAVFFLQQSIEKSAKSFGSLIADMPLDRLKKVGHFPFKLFSRLFLQFAEAFKRKNGAALNGSIAYISQYYSDNSVSEMTKENQIWSKLLEREELSPFILGTQIQKVLANIRISHNEIELDAKAKDFIASLEDFLKQQCGENCSVSIDTLRSMLKIYLRNILQIIEPLAFLVLIMPGSCAQNTRYPSKKSNPLELYGKEHPIVKSFENIVEVCIFVFDHLANTHKIFEESEKSEERIQQ